MPHVTTESLHATTDQKKKKKILSAIRLSVAKSTHKIYAFKKGLHNSFWGFWLHFPGGVLCSESHCFCRAVDQSANLQIDPKQPPRVREHHQWGWGHKVRDEELSIWWVCWPAAGCRGKATRPGCSVLLEFCKKSNSNWDEFPGEGRVDLYRTQAIFVLFKMMPNDRAR